MTEQQGTGKHPHKSTEEPYPHHKGESGSGKQEASHRSDGGSESSDLKEREYRDEQGNIHHHTRTAKEEKNKSTH